MKKYRSKIAGLPDCEAIRFKTSESLPNEVFWSDISNVYWIFARGEVVFIQNGDWIIKLNGDTFALPPSMFKAIYEAAS